MRPATLVDHETGLVTRTPIRHTSACGVRVFSSRKIAHGEAALIRRDEGRRLQVTHCQTCHGYHLSTPVAVTADAAAAAR